MEYSVGSLADLISGKKTPNKTKVIQKSFTPIKKELPDLEVNSKPAKVKSPKTPKIESPVFETNATSIKKELPDVAIKSKLSKVKSPKTPKIKSPGNSKKSPSNGENELDGTFEKEKPKVKKHKLNLSQSEDSTSNEVNINLNGKLETSKGKKRKSDQSNVDIADSDTEETTPKKPKLSINETNAASRIKNKINKEHKNSSEYKDKTLFVGNIPINITKKEIKKHFRKYGLIDSVRIRGIAVADPKTSKKVAAIKKEFHPDRNTVYAFIRFQNTEDAKKAEAENGELFLEHHLRVHYCDSSVKPDESKAIFVGNLPFNVEDEQLWNIFKPCGSISHVRIIRDGRTGMGKGFGYVNFKDPDAVQLALEMEKVTLNDRELRISLCNISRANKKKIGKKPINRNGMSGPKDQENGDGGTPKEKKVFKGKNGQAFAGTKFSDIKKKKKFSKSTLEKKKLAKKLVGTKAETS